MPRAPSRRSLGHRDEGALDNVSGGFRITRKHIILFFGAVHFTSLQGSQSRARALATQATITHRTIGPRMTRESRDKSIILTRQGRRNIQSLSPTPRSCLNVTSLSTPSNLFLTELPKQQPRQISLDAAYSKVGLSDFASAIFDAPHPSAMLRDLASELTASSNYDAVCQRFLSSLESKSTSGIVENHFIDILSAICHHCHPLGPQDIPEFNAFAFRAYEGEDSDDSISTEEHFFMMGMRRGPVPDTWRWADLLVIIDVQPASSSFGPHSSRSSPAQQPTSPIGNEPDDDASTSSPHQRERTNSPFALPPCAFRLRKYAESVMISKGNRRHVVGLLATGPNVSFWYFDRGGGFFSTPIHLRTNSVEITSTVMRLVLSSAAAFGLEPIIRSSSPWKAFESVKGSYVSVDGLQFLLQKTLHVSRELEGRGTVVLTARKGVEHEGQANLCEASIPMDVIVKLSWQDLATQFEDMLFRRAQECGVEGIAKFYCSSKPASLSTGPRRFLGLISGVHYHDRELRVQVMGPLCVPLYRVKEIEVFKTAFRSLVKGTALRSLSDSILISFSPPKPLSEGRDPSS